MLIRSQDKKTLINFEQVTDLGVVKLLDGFGINAYYAFSVSDEYSSMCIGEYSTEEKAIRVLDMIEGNYQYNERCKARGEEAGMIPSYAFQMPNDEEVEE